MAAVLRLYEEGAFTLLLPYSVQAEMNHPHTPAEVKRKAGQLIFSIQVELTVTELALHDKIRDLIRGNARLGQHDRDAFHLVESAKYGGRHFITNDGRLLRKAEEIWALLQMKVLKPSEFLSAYSIHSANRRSSGPQSAGPRRQDNGPLLALGPVFRRRRNWDRHRLYGSLQHDAGQLHKPKHWRSFRPKVWDLMPTMRTGGSPQRPPVADYFQPSRDR